jgi:glutathione S-transferase
MPKLTLFVSPNSCARVPTIALEETGAPFDTELIRTAAQQQYSPDYLKINPKGKVPALLVDGEPLTENVAILRWLHHSFPAANLLPPPEGPLGAERQTADLAFFSATVHPNVTRIAMPFKFIEDWDLSFDIVRPKGVEDMMKIMLMIDRRLEDGPWWYGADWSVVDGYLYWVWSRITVVGFPSADFANLRRHHDLSNDRPAVQRAMAREAENIEILKAEGLYRAPR